MAGRRCPALQGISANGIEVSPDGRYYFIGGWGTEKLYRLSREAPYQRDELWVGSHIDNVHFDDSGRLLAAGHDATAQGVFDCVLNPDGSYTTDNSRCTDIISKVLRVDQSLQNDEEIFRYRTNDYLAPRDGRDPGGQSDLDRRAPAANASPSSRIRSRERPTSAAEGGALPFAWSWLGRRAARGRRPLGPRGRAGSTPASGTALTTWSIPER